jgi:pilus assembly protein CpaB
MKNTSGHHKYVAAAQTMTAGEILHPASLRMVDWPSDLPLTGTFTSPDQVEGRVLLYPISSGEPILDQQLSAAGSGPGLSPKIPDGMRAISLKSDEVVGVAGFLLPGTHVDVLVTYHIAPSPDPLTATVLQDVQILTAGQKMQPDPDGKPNTVDVVTLLVTPDDAEKVVLASSEGTVHFVLRNGSDHAHTDDNPANLSDFGPIEKPHAPVVAQATRPPAPSRPVYTVETIRGDKQSVETFQ